MVAVLDVGKTNVKLSAAAADGTIVETLSVANPVRPGPPWRHHDLRALSEWVFETLATLSRRHAFGAFVTAGHGSGGVLTGADPDAGDGAALPMIDYEQSLPADIGETYAPLAGSFLDRGSATMHCATHQARQLYWMEQHEPQAFAKARWYLGVPQYWAWRLTGVAASETSFLGAQSHLWNVAERRWAPIVSARGWERLMPPFARAWQALAPVRPELVRRFDLPNGLPVLTGGHDSSLNHYRYHAAGLRDFTVISTGTWIVGFSGSTPLERLDEHRGMTLNSDVFGDPLGGILTMGGREFSRIAGRNPPAEDVPLEILARLLEERTFAIPSFGDNDGLFPGSAGRGRIIGPSADTPMERKALALLYCALLTVECLEALGSDRFVVLDGSFLRDPLYAQLVAALLPDRQVHFNLDAYGVAAGAALLAGQGTRRNPAPLILGVPTHLEEIEPELARYAADWRRLARAKPGKRDEFEHTKGSFHG
ncbi:putative carbohydrate kinase protein (plasmid) [Sinorhizobium fredii NGR234]|uniref:Carbohydrate kinase protein n=1 Tax=Sinorhizobium fredii (strain NBRC 101917 / NGR234) TaxID=394 RepID=C3KRA3_SINFN|nr:putative carbohydrate kinase protein [Sinorhizobium fredii NGR234]